VTTGDQARAGDSAAGTSARREFERRRASREERVRTRYPRIGGFLLAVSDDPQSTRAWSTGAEGERVVGAQLESLASKGVSVMHDRRIPRTRSNIDHIAVSGHGVFVIDAKKYKGRPALRVEGGLLRPRTEKLLVGRRDCTKLVDGVLKQVDLVRAALDDASVPVVGALCFVDADWPLIGGAFRTRGVHVLWPRRLGQLLTAGEAPLRDPTSVWAQIETAFPPA
jgi:hypothetical protein